MGLLDAVTAIFIPILVVGAVFEAGLIALMLEYMWVGMKGDHVVRDMIQEIREMRGKK